MTFLSFRVSKSPNQLCSEQPNKVVILSEALRRSMQTEGLWREVEGPQRCVLADAVRTLSTTEAPDELATIFRAAENQNL